MPVIFGNILTETGERLEKLTLVTLFFFFYEQLLKLHLINYLIISFFFKVTQ